MQRITGCWYSSAGMPPAQARRRQWDAPRNPGGCGFVMQTDLTGSCGGWCRSPLAPMAGGQAPPRAPRHQGSALLASGGLRPPLCSVFLDTTGREVTVRRPVEYDAKGWPTQTGAKSLVIEAGKVRREALLKRTASLCVRCVRSKHGAAAASSRMSEAGCNARACRSHVPERVGISSLAPAAVDAPACSCLVGSSALQSQAALHW